MTRFGNPWTYALRDVLYSATNLEQAIKILTDTPRTCAIHLGIASVSDRSFRMLEYSQNILNNYDDNNYTHYTAAHPKIKGIAFFDKHTQPSNDNCIGMLMSNVISLYMFRPNITRNGIWRASGESSEAVIKPATRSSSCGTSRSRSS